MHSVADIIALWPSLGEFAADLEVGYETAKAWRARNSIPGKRWLDLIAAAERRRIAGVTLDLLATLARQAA